MTSKFIRTLVVLKGGLGNQLFQFSIARYLALKNGVTPIYVRFWPREKTNSRDVRQEAEYLDIFVPDAKSLDVRHSSLLNPLLRSAITLDNLVGRVRAYSGGSFKQWINDDLPADVFDQKLDMGIRWLNFSGCSIRAADFNKIWASEVLSSHARENPKYVVWEKLAKKERPIMVHWRQGDYQSLSNLYGELSPDYFLGGIRALKDQQPVWLFTDATGDRAQQLRKMLGAERLFSPREELSSLETLQLLTKNSGLVCSNSTYSWWAAFMSDHQSVYEPSKFLSSKINVFSELRGPL